MQTVERERDHTVLNRGEENPQEEEEKTQNFNAKLCRERK